MRLIVERVAHVCNAVLLSQAFTLLGPLHKEELFFVAWAMLTGFGSCMFLSPRLRQVCLCLLVGGGHRK